MTLLLSLPVLAAISSAASVRTSTHASERQLVPSEPGPLERPMTGSRAWYGWETLVSDGASATFLWSGLVISDRLNRNEAVAAPIGVLGVAGYGLGAPIIHWLHERQDLALLSLGARILVLPVMFLLSTVLVCNTLEDCSEHNGSLLPAPYAIAASQIVTAVFDAWVADAPERAAEVPPHYDEGE